MLDMYGSPLVITASERGDRGPQSKLAGKTNGVASTEFDWDANRHWDWLGDAVSWNELLGRPKMISDIHLRLYARTHMEATLTMHAHAHTLKKLSAYFFITNVYVTIRMPEVSST